MTFKWGDPIECNGVRPDWLRGRQPLSVDTGIGPGDYWLYENARDYESDAPVEDWAWSHSDGAPNIRRIKLPADHPAYVALARGFTPWSGGESAPNDWDATQPVLFRNGGEHVSANFNWAIPHMPSIGETPADIIGYRKRSDSRTDYVRIAPMTLDEWKTIQFHPGATTWAQSVGLIRPETTAERFTRETGHAVTEAVEAALNWKGE